MTKLEALWDDIIQAGSDGYHYQPGNETLLALVAVAKLAKTVIEESDGYPSAWEFEHGVDADGLHVKLTKALEILESEDA